MDRREATAYQRVDFQAVDKLACRKRRIIERFLHGQVAIPGTPTRDSVSGIAFRLYGRGQYTSDPAGTGGFTSAVGEHNSILSTSGRHRLYAR